MRKRITKQVAFNRNWRHFIVNGARRSTKKGYSGLTECRYRLDGTAACPIRCGIGILMADKDYRPDMEGLAADMLPKRLGFSGTFWGRLQQSHDDAKSRRQHRAALVRLAKDFNLRVPKEATP